MIRQTRSFSDGFKQILYVYAVIWIQGSTFHAVYLCHLSLKTCDLTRLWVAQVKDINTSEGTEKMWSYTQFKNSSIICIRGDLMFHAALLLIQHIYSIHTYIHIYILYIYTPLSTNFQHSAFTDSMRTSSGQMVELQAVNIQKLSQFWILHKRIKATFGKKGWSSPLHDVILFCFFQYPRTLQNQLDF